MREETELLLKKGRVAPEAEAAAEQFALGNHAKMLK